jgi:2-amino-4-hydroxy-6-hydroxymethyldihydropteridine diphosphokinase
MESPRLAYVGLGANLGDARGAVQRAVHRLGTMGLVRHSALYRSAPVQASGPDFVNAVAELKTDAAPLALLDALQAIEQRVRPRAPVSMRLARSTWTCC